jgi:hypothetical protein
MTKSERAFLDICGMCNREKVLIALKGWRFRACPACDGTALWPARKRERS